MKQVVHGTEVHGRPVKNGTMQKTLRHIGHITKRETLPFLLFSSQECNPKCHSIEADFGRLGTTNT